jgi:hypothetical protein
MNNVSDLEYINRGEISSKIRLLFLTSKLLSKLHQDNATKLILISTLITLTVTARSTDHRIRRGKLVLLRF